MNLLWRYYEFIFVILSLYFVFTGENVIWYIFHIHGFITCFLSMTLVILSKKFQSSRSGKLTWLVDEALILRRRSISSNKSLVITCSAIMNAKQSSVMQNANKYLNVCKWVEVAGWNKDDSLFSPLVVWILSVRERKLKYKKVKMDYNISLLIIDHKRIYAMELLGTAFGMTLKLCLYNYVYINQFS